MKEKSDVDTSDRLSPESIHKTIGIVPQIEPQLPNCIREALLGMGAYKTAITLDLLFTLGFECGQWVTYQQVLDACREYTSIHILREGLQHFSIARRKLPTITPGRPTFEYRLPYHDRLKSQLVMQYSYVTDVLALSDFRSGKTYKMALHRELIYRESNANGGNGASFSRPFLCNRLNISASTCRRYEKELGIYVEARYRERNIDSKTRLLFVPEERAHNGMWLEIGLRGGGLKRFPALRAIAGFYLKQGYDIYLKKQITNLYHPVTPNWVQTPEQWQAQQQRIFDFFN